MQETALYLEADEDITSAIDKLSKAPASSVQIVVPKRSTMLQSIINLKLLKKAAETHHKQLVLVTGDKIATDLASRVGLAVAPSLGAKAVLSAAEMPSSLKNNEEVIEADDPAPPAAAPETSPPKPSKGLPVLKRRDLTDAPAVAPTPKIAAAPDLPTPSAPEPLAPKDASAKSPGGPKVPNFNLFQSRLKWVGLAVIIIVGFFVFMAFFTNAKITLYAAGTQVSVDTSFAVDAASNQSAPANSVLAGRTITASKDLSGPFTPTGQQNVGTKATGNMTIYNAYDLSSHTLVAGTRLQAPDGKVFLTDDDVTVPPASLSPVFPFTPTPGKATVGVTASDSGDSYNEAPAQYTIVAYSGTMQQKIYGQGDQMSGGTSKIVTIVAQSDVDSAKAALLTKDAGNIVSELKTNIPAGYTAIAASAATTTSAVTPSPAVGQQADTASIQLKVTYTELAVKTSDFQTFVRQVEQNQIGGANQIYDDGLGSAQINATGQDSLGRPTFHLATTSFSGAKLNATQIAAQLKGKRYGDAANYASGLPGVSQATISIWPPWAGTLPSNAKKIKVTIKVAKQ